jgi:hypothetical protein
MYYLYCNARSNKYQIQFVLSKYFNIVFLEPLYGNKQVFVALINTFFEARDRFSVTFQIILVIYFKGRMSDYGSRALRHTFFLIDNLGIDDLGSISLS